MLKSSTCSAPKLPLVVDTKDNSNESSIYFDLLSSEILPSKDDNNSKKRKKENCKTTEVVDKVIGTGKHGIVCILLDTGASATILLKDSIRGLT